MTFTPPYTAEAPTREAVDALPGLTVLDFGVDWCPHCQAAGPVVEAALATAKAIRHLRIEDGRGRRLGRTFGVTLWPTLVFLRDGEEMARLVRPRGQAAVEQALAAANEA
jgi:thioredoxin 1